MDFSKLSPEQQMAVAKRLLQQPELVDTLTEKNKAAFDDYIMVAQEAAAESIKPIEEMHPDVSMGDRAVAKNFAKDTRAMVRYLRKENPGLQFLPKGDRVLIKKPDEDDWRVLDPAGFDWQDLSDLAYDIPASLMQGVMAGKAGLAGGLAAGPGGALAAAAPTLFATGAAREGIKQGVGTMAGIPRNVGVREIMAGGALDAATAPLLGTGATFGQATKAAAKAGVDPAALYQTQKGALGQLGSAMAPRLGAIASGAPSKTLARTPKLWNKMRQLENATPPGESLPSKVFGELQDEIYRTGERERKKVGDQISAALGTGATIDVRPLLKDTVSELRVLYNRAKETGADADWATFEVAYKQLLSKFGKVSRDAKGNLQFKAGNPKVSAKSFEKLRRSLNTMAKGIKDINRAQDKYLNADPDKVELMNIAQALESNADTMLDAAVSASGQRRLQGLRGQYREIKDIQRNVAPLLHSRDTQAANALKRIDRRVGETDALKALDKASKGKIQEKVELLDYMRQMGDTSKLGAWAPPTDIRKRAPLAAALSLAGGALGWQSGGGLPAASLGSGAGLLAGSVAGSRPVLRGAARMGQGYRGMKRFAQEPLGLGLRTPQVTGRELLREYLQGPLAGSIPQLGDQP